MYLANPSANFTRPANTTAYASGDLVANSTTAGSVSPLSFTLGNSAGTGQFRLSRVRLLKTDPGVTNAAFRLHLYEASPTVTNGDNGAWLSNKAANWLGAIDITSMTAFSDGAAGNGATAAGAEMFIRMSAGKTIYGLLEARGAYTPASGEVFTAYLEELDAY